MYSPLAVLPLHLACQLIDADNFTATNVSLVLDRSLVPKVATELPDGYAVFPDIGVAYKVYKNKLLWDKAQKICIADGGYLAVLDSFRKVEVATGLKETSANPYVGFHRIFDSTEWTEMKTGLTAVAIPWRSDSPDSDATRKCVTLWADGSGLYATRCNEVHPFICEVPIFKE
ncbi:snaclec bitiscetin subunit alpha-like isoform X2 [Neodiprion fabricii]|uniref:snaclec bitiscetin subunit alpha-like isoform X2 n=1 Tax=Neodiprion fabricii TaxID=2872261 RepID=UPI001ED92D8C|nr:snaclec bitiscetin subunit alpha-like isoform X2 [Neodiprion fabricii]